jgi:hypothetical protein
MLQTDEFGLSYAFIKTSGEGEPYHPAARLSAPFGPDRRVIPI